MFNRFKKIIGAIIFLNASWCFAQTWEYQVGTLPSTYTVTMSPGQTVVKSISVFNFSNEKLSFETKFYDCVPQEQKVYDCLTQNRLGTTFVDVSALVDESTDEKFTIDPQSAYSVNVRLHIPEIITTKQIIGLVKLSTKRTSESDSVVDFEVGTFFSINLIEPIPKKFEATWQSQTIPTNIEANDQYFHTKPGSEVKVQVRFKNTGTTTWENNGENEVTLAIYKDLKMQSAPPNTCYSNPDTQCTGIGTFGESYFYHPSWHTIYRVTTLQENTVRPESIGTFQLTFKIPETTPQGSYREDLSLAYGSQWMDNYTNGDAANKAHVWIGFTIDPY